MFSPKEIKAASRVSSFMLELAKKYDGTERGQRAFDKCIPFGDMAYGSALTSWYENGSPKKAYFSWAPGQDECPALMEFREELTKEFGLPILTREEAEIESMQHRKVLTTKVFDWGLN